jgi:hypothetical protein
LSSVTPFVVVFTTSTLSTHVQQDLNEDMVFKKRSFWLDTHVRTTQDILLNRALNDHANCRTQAMQVEAGTLAMRNNTTFARGLGRTSTNKDEIGD